MPRRSIAVKACAILLGIFGLVGFVPAALPYSAFQRLLNGLSPDGKFNSLRPWNADIFKILFVSGGLFLLFAAAVTWFQRWYFIRSFFQVFRRDAGLFFRSLRPQKKETGFLAAIAMLMAFAIIFRLVHAEWPMKYDEAYTYVLFGRSLFSGLTDYHMPNNHVLHSILVFFSTQIFGPAPWAVRLPAFIAGVLLVPAIYWVGKRFYDRWTGLAAAALVAWSPSLIAYSNNARGYTMVALFTALLLILGNVVRREKNLLVWMLLVLFSALGFYTVPVMLFPFGILFLWLFLENLAGDTAIGLQAYHSRWEFFLYWLVSGFAAAFLTLIFYLPVLVYSGAQKLFFNIYVAPVAWGDLIEALSHRFGETWIEWTLRVPVVVIAILLVGLVLGWVFHRRLSQIKIPLQVASLIWIPTQLLIQRPNAFSKVWVFLQPLILLWAAAGLIGLLQKVRPRFIKGISLALPVLGLILLAGLWQSIRLIPQLPEIWAFHGEDERAVLLIRQHLQAKDAIVVAPVLDAPIWYYSELHGIPDAYTLSRSEDFQRLFVLVHLSEDQTLESVILNRGYDPQGLALSSVRLLSASDNIQVFEVLRK